MNLHGKKILFLSPHFFGYEKAITTRLREWGAEVDFFNERPADSVLAKGIIRVKSSLYQHRIHRYYREILNQTKDREYSFFLLIKGESVPFFFLDELRRRNPEAVRIFYSYDAVSEYPRVPELYPYFDKNFTFEPADAVKYKLHFRPLFFLQAYKRSQNSATPHYDLVFIGSAHSDRFLIGEKVKESCQKAGLKTFFYYYAAGKTVFLLKKLFDRNTKDFDLKKLSFKILKHEEIAALYRDSVAVLDINKPFQKGMTMRTFEALAAGKKLITTNQDIRKYPFYNPENIHILQRDDLTIDPLFFRTPFKEASDAVLTMMGLDSWLHCLLIESQDEYWKEVFRQDTGIASEES